MGFYPLFIIYTHSSTVLLVHIEDWIILFKFKYFEL